MVSNVYAACMHGVSKSSDEPYANRLISYLYFCSSELKTKRDEGPCYSSNSLDSNDDAVVVLKMSSEAFINDRSELGRSISMLFLTLNGEKHSRKLAAFKVRSTYQSSETVLGYRTYNWQFQWLTCNCRPMRFRSGHHCRGCLPILLQVRCR
jgi:hypothetical protein